ncbi:MAG: DUF4263 domain-containing protein [Fimbriimonadaceae bacterium]|nr:DUF4263 domain-containing protein [Fimbriimonadaceae bacterium]
MAPLEPRHQFDIRLAVRELAEFGAALSTLAPLGEQRDIVPFFRARPQLSALLGSCSVRAVARDVLAPEFSLGDLRVDLLVGDADRSAFCLVEFEDAARSSVFQLTRRGVPAWSARFERGFSQLVDWFWKLDDLRHTTGFRSCFGDHPHFTGLLLIGRDQPLRQQEHQRLLWRERHVPIAGNVVQCFTYDQLYETLRARCESYGLQT